MELSLSLNFCSTAWPNSGNNGSEEVLAHPVNTSLVRCLLAQRERPYATGF